jgi:hypothetical protein
MRQVGGDCRAVHCGCRSGFRDDQFAVRSKFCRERAGAGAGVDHNRAERAVGFDREGVDIVGQPLGNNDKLTVWADGERDSAGHSGGEELGGVLDLLQAPVIVEAEADYAAGTAGVEDVYQILPLGNCNRLATAGRSLVGQKERAALHAESGDGAASGVDCEEQRMVRAEGQ